MRQVPGEDQPHRGSLSLAGGVILACEGRASNITFGLLGAWFAASAWLIGRATVKTCGVLNDLVTGVLVCLRVALRRRLRRALLAGYCTAII